MIRLVLVIAALGVLSGCGVRGGLQRADPLWNADEAIARECARQRAAGEELDPRCPENQPAPR